MPEPSKKSSNWLVVVAIVLFLAGVAASYILRNAMNSDTIASAPLDKSCDLRKGPCQSQFAGGGSVSFSISPSTIPILKPLKLTVNVSGIDVNKVDVNFIGLNMDMGYNHATLTETGAREFKGEFTIPICVQQRMEWEARVLIQTADGTMAAPYRFYTIRE